MDRGDAHRIHRGRATLMVMPPPCGMWGGGAHGMSTHICIHAMHAYVGACMSCTHMPTCMGHTCICRVRSHFGSSHSQACCIRMVSIGFLLGCSAWADDCGGDLFCGCQVSIGLFSDTAEESPAKAHITVSEGWSHCVISAQSSAGYCFS